MIDKHKLLILVNIFSAFGVFFSLKIFEIVFSNIDFFNFNLIKREAIFYATFGYLGFYSTFIKRIKNSPAFTLSTLYVFNILFVLFILLSLKNIGILKFDSDLNHVISLYFYISSTTLVISILYARINLFCAAIFNLFSSTLLPIFITYIAENIYDYYSLTLKLSISLILITLILTLVQHLKETFINKRRKNPLFNLPREFNTYSEAITRSLGPLSETSMIILSVPGFFIFFNKSNLNINLEIAAIITVCLSIISSLLIIQKSIADIYLPYLVRGKHLPSLSLTKANFFYSLINKIRSFFSDRKKILQILKSIIFFFKTNLRYKFLFEGVSIAFAMSIFYIFSSVILCTLLFRFNFSMIATASSLSPTIFFMSLLYHIKPFSISSFKFPVYEILLFLSFGIGILLKNIGIGSIISALCAYFVAFNLIYLVTYRYGKSNIISEKFNLNKNF